MNYYKLRRVFEWVAVGLGWAALVIPLVYLTVFHVFIGLAICVSLIVSLAIIVVVSEIELG